MPPPRHHHRSGSHRPGRRFGGRPRSIYFDGSPDTITETILVVPSDLDTIMVPPTDDPEFKTPGAGHYSPYLETYTPNAGDLLPTIVTGDSAKAYLREVDTGYSVLNADIVRSPVAPEFKASWAMQHASWQTFYLGALASVGFFDAKSVMGQTDRYATELANWRKSFQVIGGAVTGPSPVPPGQGIPTEVGGDTFKLVAAIGAIAAIVVFGPSIARHFS